MYAEGERSIHSSVPRSSASGSIAGRWISPLVCVGSVRAMMLPASGLVPARLTLYRPIRFAGGCAPVVSASWYCSASVPRMPMPAMPLCSESRRKLNRSLLPSCPVNSPGAR